MNDVALVALITTSGTVLVALLGYIANFFSEGARDRKRAELESERASDQARFEALRLFSAALIDASSLHSWSQRQALQGARVAFVSTLRRGEGEVAEFTDTLTNAVVGFRGTESLAIAVDGGDQLFAWLRGDLTPDDLQLNQALPVATEEAEPGHG